MQKILLILGSSESDKMWMADQIASEYPKKQVSVINAKHLVFRNNFNFGFCDENTKLLVVHELDNAEKLFEFYTMINGFQVNEPNKPIYTINPRIIITSSTITPDHLTNDASFTNRFDVLDMDNPKHI